MRKQNLWKVQSINQDIVGIMNKETQESRNITWEDIYPKRKSHQISTKTLLIEKDGLYHIKSNKFLFLFLILILCGTLLSGFLMMKPTDCPQDLVFNRYLEEVTEDEKVNTDSTQTRFKFNSYLFVKKNTIQNLNMENLNQGKNMEMIIKIKDDVVFKSHLIGFKQKLVGDVLTKELPKGVHNGIAEVYTYKEIDGNQIKVNQTNFEIKLEVVK